MTLHFFTFCVYIERHSKKELINSLSLLIKSLEKNVIDYQLIIFTNFEINKELLSKKIILKPYYFNNEKIYDENVLNLNYKKHDQNKFLNLSFNKIYIYKDLYQEFKKDFIWTDLDNYISNDLSYINEYNNCFLENGGESLKKNPLFKNNDEITVPRKNYIQGNFWKLNINLYHDLMKTLKIIQEKNLILRFDLQDLFNYHIYILNKNNINKFSIVGNTVKKNVINGLSIWSKEGFHHPNINGLNNLFIDKNKLKSNYYKNKEIHIVSFVFYELNKFWNLDKFKEIFLSK